MTSLPPVIRPMLAVAGHPFDAPDYLFEPKWDGYRCLAFLTEENTRLQSRNLRIMNQDYPELLGLHRLVKAKPCILDGEIVAFHHGRPDFSALRSRPPRRVPVVYMVFDLLYAHGRDLTGLPLSRRRELLVEAVPTTDRLFLTEGVRGRGRDFFAAAVALGLEGVVAKQLDSPYLAGQRSRYWIKCKKKRVASFIICGYTQKERSPTPGALALGAYKSGGLSFFGTVGTGIGREDLRSLAAQLTALTVPDCPFPEKITAKDFRWVRPVLVADIAYLEVTPEGRLRHPVFLRLRPDLSPADCVFPPAEEREDAEPSRGPMGDPDHQPE